MALFNKKSAGSDDEDDLESLRLAALKSLKPKSVTTVTGQNKSAEVVYSKPQHSYKSSTFGAAQTTRHHSRGFRNGSGRPGRNGMSQRVRTNTNLISIQTIDDTPMSLIMEVKENQVDEVPKLVLPQDRYHKPLLLNNTTKESTSNKFDRYDDNSEDSDSDSGDEQEQVTKVTKRERKDSIEMLMDELENEINVLDGKIDPKEPESKIKESDNESSDSKNIQDSPEKAENSAIKEDSDMLVISINEPELVQTDVISAQAEETFNKDITVNAANAELIVTQPKPLYKYNNSPYSSPDRNRTTMSKRNSRSRSPQARPRPQFESQYKSPYRSPRRSRSPSRKTRYSPQYKRPLSPLTLNTEVLNSITMAPLSPRSAAFVLQNREILARRQMSPRRSLSRSLSPRRRSRSPRRSSLSPRRRERSRSPLSPKRRSSSPRSHRRSPNYRGNRLPKRNSNSPLSLPKQPVHKRLGSRNVSPHNEHDRKSVPQPGKRKRTSRSISLSLSPSPDRNYYKRPLNETTGHVNNDLRRGRDKIRKESPKPKSEKPLDPVLEARRRKFESPAQIERNGVIKLKSAKSELEEFEEKKERSDASEGNESPQAQESEQESGNDNEEVDDSVLDLNTTLGDLWSDEESDSENEGRFKSKPSSQKQGITILPFTKLMAKPDAGKSRLSRDSSYRDRRSDRRQKVRSRKRSRSPLKLSSNKSDVITHNRERDVPDSVFHVDRVDKVIEAKLKIKGSKRLRSKADEPIKSKEKIEKKDVKEEAVEKIADLTTIHPEKHSSRKVMKVQKVSEVKLIEAEQDDEPEVIIEKEDDNFPHKDDDSDLRAELMRRRLARVARVGAGHGQGHGAGHGTGHGHGAGPGPGALPARLLQTALQGVVPNTNRSRGSSADRRVLVLKRLAAPKLELPPVNKVSKKEGKLPIHMRLGLSSAADVSLDEVVRERRPKRTRSGRRKKATVQV